MVYKNKYTKKIYKYRKGGSTEEKKNEENNIKVTNKEINSFPELDFSHAFFIDNKGLGFTPELKKFIEESLIIKKKKKNGKENIKKKISTLQGLTPIKRMGKGLFSAINEGMKQGMANYDRFFTNMKELASCYA